MSLVYLVRHGEVHNPDGVLYGRLPNFRLSADGVGMAATTGGWLVGRDIAVVHSSPLQRAVETATAIGDTLGLPVEIDERLIESGSRFEGRRFDGAAGLLRPDVLRHLYNPLRPSWGEPFTEVADRMLAAADAARVAAAGRDAVCVSHQLPIWVARRAVEGKHLWHRPDRRECALASVTTIRYDEGGRPVSTDYNEPAGSVGRRTGKPRRTLHD